MLLVVGAVRARSRCRVTDPHQVCQDNYRKPCSTKARLELITAEGLCAGQAPLLRRMGKKLFGVVSSPRFGGEMVVHTSLHGRGSLFGDVACSLDPGLARACLSHGAYLCFTLLVVNVIVTGASRYRAFFWWIPARMHGETMQCMTSNAW